MIRQGDLYWVDLRMPHGSEPGFRRPVVVVQGDDFNRSKIATTVCVAVSSNLRLAEAPGNVLLGVQVTRLPQNSVANVSQVVTLDKSRLRDRVSRLPPQAIEEILSGIDAVLGR